MDTELAKRLRDSGLPWHAIAKQMGVTVHILRRNWSNAGFLEDSRYRSECRTAITLPIIQRAIELRKGGLRWKQIAELLEVKWDALYAACRNVRPAPEVLSEVVIKAMEMYSKGIRWKVIGHSLGVNTNVIGSQVRAYKRAKEMTVRGNDHE